MSSTEKQVQLEMASRIYQKSLEQTVMLMVPESNESQQEGQ